MLRSTLRAVLPGVAFVFLLTSSLAAQDTPASPVAPEAPKVERRTSCRIIPDTAALLPRPQQIAERNELRDSLLAVASRHGVAEPTGLLFVLVDSIRRTGRVLYLETNLPEAAVHESTRQMETYVSSLPQGRGYQALVRVDRPYVPPRAGLNHCGPELKNQNQLLEMTARVAHSHPKKLTPESPGEKTAYVRLVVDHEGNVAYVDVDRPTGDEYLDGLTPEVASRLKFLPPTLDGVPFDSRIRFSITYSVP